MVLIILVYLLVGLLAAGVAWSWWLCGYFKRHGIQSPPTYFPIIGHVLPTFRGKVHLKDFIYNLYHDYPNERYVGTLQFAKPLICLRDVELIKQVTIKDFDHFIDRSSSLDEDTKEIIFGNTLFNLRGQKWRDMRATLSPAFTSSKMRGMFQFITECGDRMTKYYLEEMKQPESRVRGLVEMEMKDAFTRYTNDVIASCAFGFDVNSFTNKNNEFYLMGKEITNFTGVRTLFKFFIILVLPKIAKALKLQLFAESTQNFYRRLVWDTMKDREDRGIVRKDMINILMDARKGTLKHESNDDGKEAGFATVEESSVGRTIVKRVWSKDEIVAQAVVFLAAGFDTSSTLLCFMAHELALNISIQKRLQGEIDEVAATTDGNLTYDYLHNMKYLDMVVSETLRKWPPAFAIDRKCVNPYTLPPPREGGKEYRIQVNDGVNIPIYAMHHDPQYFKNPEIFDPERFSDENKHNIVPFTFIPFGIGPRNCIGSRFALMEAKAVIYNILLKFDIVTTAKTQNPIKLALHPFNLYAEKGFWVGLKPRDF